MKWIVWSRQYDIRKKRCIKSCNLSKNSIRILKFVYDKLFKKKWILWSKINHISKPYQANLTWIHLELWNTADLNRFCRIWKDLLRSICLFWKACIKCTLVFTPTLFVFNLDRYLFEDGISFWPQNTCHLPKRVSYISNGTWSAPQFYAVLRKCFNIRNKNEPKILEFHLIKKRFEILKKVILLYFHITFASFIENI